ncbi:hypothetical protein AC578_10778 [Pseudocercospora eumusae]|uniref:Uncharacterized protein n=1 Tax=Pseudocercospora eumusae TaxID=321146 RepID=A0A139GZW8_9PEZI|nr:hypothetical protein AC578_10778 [Pseudocercospora eumusae]
MSEEDTAGAGAQFDIAQGGSGIGLSSSEDCHMQIIFEELAAIEAAPSSRRTSGVNSSSQHSELTDG